MKPMTTRGTVQHLATFLRNPISVLVFGRPRSGGTALLQALNNTRFRSQTGRQLTSMYFRQSPNRKTKLPSGNEGVDVHLIDEFEFGTISSVDPGVTRLVAFTGHSWLELAVEGFQAVFRRRPDLVLQIEEHDTIVPRDEF